MRILKFNVNAQKLEKDHDCDFSGIVPGTAGYLQAQFYFTKEWDNTIKIAEFYGCGNVEPAAVINGKCIIPEGVLKGEVFSVKLIGKRGKYRITTGKCIVNQRGW